jgi:thimet oligopeptidase
VRRPSEWDFIEAPSQFLEEWIYDYAVLRRFAKHVETGQVIPEALVRKLRDARDFGRGTFVQRQLMLSAISLRLHDRDPRGLDTTTVVFDASKEFSPIVMPEGTAMQASFGHLEGYTALYYTYMWSLVIAKDMHSAFTNGLMDLKQAKRYRDLVLAPGGTKPAAELVSDFLGRSYGFDAFKEWLAPRD